MEEAIESVFNRSCHYADVVNRLAPAESLAETCRRRTTGTKYLVLSSGGTVGFTHLGVAHMLSVLQPAWFAGLEGFAGTSIGAFLALLFAVGATVRETCRLMVWQNQLGVRYMFDMPRLFVQKGLVNIRSVEDRVRQCLEALQVDPDITFKGIHAMYGRKLAVCGTRVGVTAATVVFSWETTPEMPAARAVAASMAIPFLVAPYYDGISPYPIYDGALTAPVPVGVFPMAECFVIAATKSSYVGLPPQHRLKDLAVAVYNLLSTDTLVMHWARQADRTRLLMSTHNLHNTVRKLTYAEICGKFMTGALLPLVEWRAHTLVDGCRALRLRYADAFCMASSEETGPADAAEADEADTGGLDDEPAGEPDAPFSISLRRLLDGAGASEASAVRFSVRNASGSNPRAALSTASKPAPAAPAAAAEVG